MHTEEFEKGKKKRKVLLAFAIIFLLFVSFNIGAFSSERNDFIKEIARSENVYLGGILNKYEIKDRDDISQEVDFDLFWEVWDVLEKEYVDKDKLNEKEMFYGAIEGLVDSIGDPYTVFMDPRLAQEFATDLTGMFDGIGAEIGIRNEVLTIIAPLDGTPAQKAGLKAGDKVYAINGESTADIAVDEAVRKIRGPKGTEVKLTISRDGFEAAEDIIVKRDTIIIKSVKTTMLDDFYLIQITSFNDDTSGLFNEAVNEVIAKNPKGIILDLRNNPGGYLDTAVEVASEWIEEGVIVSEQFGDGQKNDFPARGRARLKDYSTVVLVNGGSASASEIVAGALKDYDAAKIIGEKTFGKGSVQTLENFKDGSAVKVTVAKWLTPNGNNINEQGIEPDEIVELSQEDYESGEDPQIKAAIEVLVGGVNN